MSSSIAAIGSWITLAMSLAALFFSCVCFWMIREIRNHVIRFDPDRADCKIILEECMKILRAQERKYSDD